MDLVLIAAIAENGVIGKDGDIPWHISEDLKRFKRLTRNHPVIMGRKTYESIPENFRPLKRRMNVVLSRNPDFQEEGIYVANSLENALQKIGTKPLETIRYDTAFIMGGASLYEEGLPLADRLEITEVHGKYEGDTSFPTVNYPLWSEVFRERHEAEPAFSFVSYVKRRAA